MLTVSQKIRTEINETDFSYFQFLQFQNCCHFLQMTVTEGIFNFMSLPEVIQGYIAGIFLISIQQVKQDRN